MRKGRIKRNKFLLIAGMISFFGSIYYGLTPSKINNFTDLMSASLSFSSIATAMFLSCFSLIPAFSNSKLVIALQELGTDIKMMDRLLMSTLIFFLNSSLTFILLFFNQESDSIFSMLISVSWFTTISMGLTSSIYIIMLLISAFEHFYEDSISG